SLGRELAGTLRLRLDRKIDGEGATAMRENKPRLRAELDNPQCVLFESLRLEDERRHPGILQDVGVIIGRAQRMERNVAQTKQIARELCDRGRCAILRKLRQPVAALEAQLHERLRYSADLDREIAVRQA